MRGLILGITLALTMPAAIRTQSTSATYIEAAKVTGGGTFVRAADHSVQMLKRMAPGEAEVHTKETDIFYVVDGEATFVAGGAVVGGRETQPNQLRGTSITGGDTYRLKKGDAIVVPAGVPHWFKDVHQPISYFTVKVMAP